MKTHLHPKCPKCGHGNFTTEITTVRDLKLFRYTDGSGSVRVCEVDAFDALMSWDYMIECQECGWHGDFSEIDEDYDGGDYYAPRAQ